MLSEFVACRMTVSERESLEAIRRGRSLHSLSEAIRTVIREVANKSTADAANAPAVETEVKCGKP